MNTDKTSNVLSLELSRENGKIKVSAHEKSSDDENTIRHYETREISEDEISKICTSVVTLLNRANRQGKVDSRTLEELQTIGHLLYDTLLTHRAKEKLAVTKSEHLLVIVDDRLVHIPWELLFDGKDFLCRRFSMGRVVRTSQKTAEPVIRKVGKPLRILVVADPRGDLEESYTEGGRLRDALDNRLEHIEINLRSTDVGVNHLKGELRNYDILHYAGHADYDVQTPSESGFLMKDGTLRASDIIHMAGPLPLPALVFSNACKSGHTQTWRVEDDFATEIYGLANAFLLAGVQHYIGTFWEVQDEPGRYFALSFYKELIRGAAVGEAVRKARSGLMERYGEDNIIWASYMLYGDPAARYVNLQSSHKTAADKKVSGNSTGAVPAAGAGVAMRSADTVLSLPRRNHPWTIMMSSLLVIIVIVGVVWLKRDMKPSSQEQQIRVAAESPELKKKRVDTLVKALITDYREQKKSGTRTVPVKDGVHSLVFLNIKTHGISEATKDYLLTGITNILRSSKRLRIVEREMIDSLLEELKLSSSELADPATALEIGKILAAQLISSGSISREGNLWQASLRLIDVETSTIRAAVTENLEKVDNEQVADRLGKALLNELRAEYPLKGSILSLKDRSAILNIGYENGASPGIKMNILSNTNENKMHIGVVEITSVSKNTSKATIIGNNSDFKEGLIVEEIL